MERNLIKQCADQPFLYKKKIGLNRLNDRVIIISGPTASGKTALSIQIARMLRGEIVSADSVQVYRGMDIGTAKAPLKERMNVPHHLIDICDLSTPFNIMEFYHLATQAIRGILARGAVPIVVGGAGFYLRSLFYGPPQGPPASIEVRQKLEKDIKKYGAKTLYEKLCMIDPKYGQTINHCDRHKIIRSLEIITLTGKRVSDFPTRVISNKPKEFDLRCWFIYFPKDPLFSRIEMRCDEIISQGFIEEVKGLIKLGLWDNASAAQAVGYRQCLKFLNSSQRSKDWECFVWEFKKASRRYAKRQFTWFRREPLFRWIDLDIYGYNKAIDMILQNYHNNK